MAAEQRLDRLRRLSNERKERRRTTLSRYVPITRTESGDPVCPYEGPVVDPCTSCGGKARERDVRICAHPNPSDLNRDKCCRAFGSKEVQWCKSCPDNPINRKPDHETQSTVQTQAGEANPQGSVRRSLVVREPHGGNLLGPQEGGAQTHSTLVPGSSPPDGKAPGRILVRGLPATPVVRAALPTPVAVPATVKYVELTWAYGVTTVPERRESLLPVTLASLKRAGFDAPRLFVDGSHDPLSWQNEFKLEVTIRNPRIRAYGNWILALYELYIRNPNADRYAIFQDDFITGLNLRKYLDITTPDAAGRKESTFKTKRAAHPRHRTDESSKVYWNLYTFPTNQAVAPTDVKSCWYESKQNGQGAVGLVFDRDGAQTLLESQHMIERPMNERIGHKSIDGGVIQALRKAGYRELVHNPSLLQHIGRESTLENRQHPMAKSFKGETFDFLTLLVPSEAKGG